MLVDLKPLDVVVCHCDGDCRDDHQYTHSGLGWQGAAKGSPRDQKGANVADENKRDDKVAVDAMEEEEFVTDEGHELPDYEQTGRKDGDEMDSDPNAMDAVAVPVPFALCCTVGKATAGGAGYVHVGETGEGEAQKSSSEYDDYDWLARKVRYNGPRHDGHKIEL